MQSGKRGRSERDDVGFINGLEILLEGEIETVGGLEVGVALPEQGDVLTQLLVGFDQLVLLPLQPFLVHLLLLLALLQLQVLLLVYHFLLLYHLPSALDFHLQLLHFPT